MSSSSFRAKYLRQAAIKLQSLCPTELMDFTRNDCYIHRQTERARKRNGIESQGMNIQDDDLKEQIFEANLTYATMNPEYCDPRVEICDEGCATPARKARSELTFDNFK